MKWYQKSGWIIFFLIIFFPVGLYLMWKYTNWNKTTKVIISAIVAFFVVCALFNNNDNVPTQGDNVTTIEESLEETAKLANAAYIETTEEVTTAPVITQHITAPSTIKHVTTTKAVTTAHTTTKRYVAPTKNYKIKLVSLTSPVGRNEMATIEIKGKPNTEYYIDVIYPSGSSTAAGLYSKTSDGNGYVSWTWKVGGRTSFGNHTINISGGDDFYSTEFTVD